MGFTFIRNSAFFTEGPMWNLIISLAFIIELFLLEELSKWRLVVILLTDLRLLSLLGHAQDPVRSARQYLLEASEVLWMRKRPLVGLLLYNMPDLS